MSIATEITRLQNAKASIKTSIENKGVTVPSATKLDGYSTLIDSIQTGGGGDVTYEEVANGNFGDNVDLVITGTKIRTFSFATAKIRSARGDNVNNIENGAFQNCKELVSAYFPNMTDFWGRNQVFQYCTSLESVNLSKAGRLGNNEFDGCSSLTKLYLPKCYQIHANCCQGCRDLTHLETNNSINFSSTYALNQCSKLMTIIMRGTTVRALSNVNNFSNTTFATGGSHLGHIYVPQSTIASYQSATNWSTLYNAYNDIFQPIEGSEWENVHIDGTPVE